MRRFAVLRFASYIDSNGEERLVDRQEEPDFPGVERSRAERATRLARLAGERESVEAALSAYQSDFPPAVDVRLRPGFIRRDQPLRVDADPSTIDSNFRPGAVRNVGARPPLTRLVHRRTRALPFYLSALFTTQCELAPGRSFVNNHALAYQAPNKEPHSWARLAGMSRAGQVRSRHVRATRALVELERARLVDLPLRGGKRDFARFDLLSDDGAESTYRVPGIAASTVDVPKAFFLNGWHLVLEPRELVTLLVIFEAHRRRASMAGVVLPESDRASHYGLSGEVYEAIHELDEFGLIDVVDPMKGRRRGRVPPPTTRAADEDPERPLPYRCQLRTSGVQRNAYDVVSRALAQSPVAPRLRE